jgi:hypothetical protein
MRQSARRCWKSHARHSRDERAAEARNITSIRAVTRVTGICTAFRAHQPWQMTPQKFTIANLATALRGKRIACALLTPYLKIEDFEHCQAFIQFEDNTTLELGLIETRDSIEYPVCERKLRKIQRVESVDEVSIRGLFVRGLYFSESVFSLGIVVNTPSLSVLCLDTMAAIRLQLHLYPLESINYHNGVIYN